MWGEIETPAQTRPCQLYAGGADSVPLASEPSAVKPDALDGCGLNIPEFVPTYCQQPPLDKAADSRAESSSVLAMVEAVALSDSPVKSQQIGEAELTVEQRREELVRQYRARPLVFFERYQAHLKPQHLVSFSHLISDPRAQHYCRVVLRRAASRTDRTRVRNQRYAALRALQKEGEYFSEEQMRLRQPLLYEQYVGQYLTEEEVLERSQEAMRVGGQEPSAGGLANLLLDSYQERLLQHRMQEQQEKEDGAEEEEEEDDEEEEEGRSKGSDWEPNQEEKALLREEFVSQMHQHFLDGKDTDFNYREVDENPDYDNLDIVSRDAEEKYFDDDDDDDDDDDHDEDEDDEDDDDNEEDKIAYKDEESKKQDSKEEDMIIQ